MTRCNNELAKEMLDGVIEDLEIYGEAPLNPRVIFLMDDDLDNDFDKSITSIDGVDVVSYTNKKRGWSGVDRCGMVVQPINDGWHLVYEYLN